MSHPDPRHDPNNVRTDDNPRAKKSKMAKKMGMKDLSKRFAKHATTFERVGHEMATEHKRNKGIAF